jgi:hypothetical protein
MKVSPYTMRILHRYMKNQNLKMSVLHKRHTMMVLHRKIKYKKEKMRVLLELSVQICKT